MTSRARPPVGPIGIVAYGAISAGGRGADAVRPARDARVTRVARDPELEAAGLRRPFCARAPLEAEGIEGPDRATTLLSIALEDCLRALAADVPSIETARIGLALGTSSGGMRAFTSGGGTPLDRTYAGPVAAAVAALARPFEPASVVLAACASSAIAIGLGRAWLEEDRCDLVLAGGFDAVSVFVAAGFECLRATCGERGPRPFRKDRDGLALGEGAAVLALQRAPERALAWITGFGATCDAHHLTAPAPDGAGLARAARAARGQASIAGVAPAIDLVSAHGTATPQNDAAEAKAIASLGTDAPAFSFKGTIGHTLGAAGALEVLATAYALAHDVAPATAGAGEVEAGVVVLDRAEARSSATALKLASAFGGANAALVLSRAPVAGAERPRPAVWASRAVRATRADAEPAAVAARSGYPVDRVARGDELVRHALAAVAALQERVGALRGAGIVVGLGLATVETNAKFQARIARPEPRRFPYTTPNAAAGECAVAFGLDGPAFAVGGGPHGGIEALAVAADLVRAGVVSRMVVVAADEAGPASEALAPGTTSGAVALLVGGSGEATLESWSVRYSPGAPPAGPLPPMHAHAALGPLVDGEPRVLHADVPWGGEARVVLGWPSSVVAERA